MNRKLPSGAAKIAKQYPEIWTTYEKLGAASAEAGPFDARTMRLVKLAIAVAAESEGAVHSHTRRALDEGAGREIERAFAAKGYRGHHARNPRGIFISGQKRGVFGVIKRCAFG